MPLPARPDLPLLDQQDALIEAIYAAEASIYQFLTVLQASVETANRLLTPEQLQEWATYTYWLGDEKIEAAWLAQALTGAPVYQSLKGRFTPVTTGICCSFCHQPLVFASRTALVCAQRDVDQGERMYCEACRPAKPIL